MTIFYEVFKTTYNYSYRKVVLSITMKKIKQCKNKSFTRTMDILLQDGFYCANIYIVILLLCKRT